MQNEEITSNVSLDELFSNSDLHSLDINSDEFAAAVAKTKNEQVDEDSAPVTEEDDTEKQEEQEVTDEPKKKSGFSKRIDKLTAEKRELERRLAELENSQPEPQVAQEVSTKPKSADFDSHEDYIEALTDWKLDQRELEREALKKRNEITSSWDAKEAPVKKEYADYDDVVNVNSFQASNASREAQVFLGDSDIGPEVIYNLIKNEDLFDEFAEANPVKQIKILTKIELALEKPVQKTAIATSAPNPPKKLNASRPVSTGKDLIQHAGEMSDAEWLRLADEHSRNKRKR